MIPTPVTISCLLVAIYTFGCIFIFLVTAAGLAFWEASTAELITYDCRSFLWMPCIYRRDIPPLLTGPLVPCNQGVSYA